MVSKGKKTIIRLAFKEMAHVGEPRSGFRLKIKDCDRTTEDSCARLVAASQQHRELHIEGLGGLFLFSFPPEDSASNPPGAGGEGVLNELGDYKPRKVVITELWRDSCSRGCHFGELQNVLPTEHLCESHPERSAASERPLLIKNKNRTKRSNVGQEDPLPLRELEVNATATATSQQRTPPSRWWITRPVIMESLRCFTGE